MGTVGSASPFGRISGSCILVLVVPTAAAAFAPLLLLHLRLAFLFEVRRLSWDLKLCVRENEAENQGKVVEEGGQQVENKENESSEALVREQEYLPLYQYRRKRLPATDPARRRPHQLLNQGAG